MTDVPIKNVSVVSQYDADYVEATTLPSVPELAFNLTIPNLLPALSVSLYQCSLATLVTADRVESLVLNSRNTGRLLVTTVIRKPFKFPVATASPEVLVADMSGTAIRAHLCGFPDADDRAALEERLPVGSVLVFPHPFYREQTDKARVLRAERPCEVRVLLTPAVHDLTLPITMPRVLTQAQKDAWWQTALTDANHRKELGNARFKAGQYELAVNAYLDGVLCLLSDLPCDLTGSPLAEDGAAPASAEIVPDDGPHQPAGYTPDYALTWRLPHLDDKNPSAAVYEAARDAIATLLNNASLASFKRGHTRLSLYLAQSSLFARRVASTMLPTVDLPDGAMKALLRLIAALLDSYRLDEAHTQLIRAETVVENALSGATHPHRASVVALREEWSQKVREMQRDLNLAEWLLQEHSWRRDRTFVHQHLRSHAGFSAEGIVWPSRFHAREAIPAAEVLLIERAFSCRRPADSQEALVSLLDHIEAHADALLPLFRPLPAVEQQPTDAAQAACAKKARLGSWPHLSTSTICRLGWSLAYRSEAHVDGADRGALTVSLGPLVASLPHDCAPNTQVLVKGDTVFLVSLRSIAAGELVTRSFCPTCLPTALRQARLAAQHNLACHCDRCRRQGDLWASGQRESEVSEWCCPVCGGPTRTVLGPSRIAPEDTIEAKEAGHEESGADVSETAWVVCADGRCAWSGENRQTTQALFHDALVATEVEDAGHDARQLDSEGCSAAAFDVDKRLPAGSWLRSMWWCRLARRSASHTDSASYTSYLARLLQQCGHYPPPAELRCFVVDMICQAIVSFRRQTPLDEEYTFLRFFGLSRGLVEACFEASGGDIQRVYNALS